MLIATELILNGAGLNAMAFGFFLSPDATTGQAFTLFIMGVAAAEAAIALSIMIAVFRRFHEIRVESISHLKG